MVPARASPETKSVATEAAYVASASRASSGSAHFSSQSSSGMPSPPMARTCGKCTWVSTKPGSTSPSRRSTTSSSAWHAGGEGFSRDDHAVAHHEREVGSARR